MTIRELVRAALKLKRDRGQVYSSTPYGYQRVGKNLRPDANELETVKVIQARRAEGWTLRRIADDLNERKVKAKKGGRWHGSAVRYILLRNTPYQAVKNTAQQELTLETADA